MNKKLMIRATIALIAFVLLWSAVYASFIITSNTATTQVGDYALVLSTPAKAPLNSNITLTATLLKNGVAMPTETITFYIDQGAWNSIGTSMTDGSGVATLQYTVTTQGALSFQARYEII